MKVVLSTVLEFDSLEELSANCADCIEDQELTSVENDGIPENWDDPDSWTEDSVKEFLKYNGGTFYDYMYGFDDIFNDNATETRVELEA